MMTGVMIVFFLYSQTDSIDDKAEKLNNKDVTLHLIRKFFSG